MGTEERDKAADELTATRVTQLVAFGRPPSDYEGGFRDGACAGWDARGQVTPDREAALFAAQRALGCERRSHYGNVEHPFCGKHGGIGQWPCRVSAEVADAILLALFNEKGNE